MGKMGKILKSEVYFLLLTRLILRGIL